MADKKMNSNDEIRFLITESYSSDGKSFENLMQEIISQSINSKNFLSDYCINKNFDVESTIDDRQLSFDERAKRSVKKCLP